MSRPALRAPAEQYGLLLDPPLAEIASLLAQNTAAGTNSSVCLHGLPLAELRSLGQKELSAAAQTYMTRLGLPSVSAQGQGFIVTGHQPEMFHPGVWVKNFAAHFLARQHQRQSLNLIVDSDLVKANAIPVPTDAGERRFAVFDTGPLQVPLEERQVAEEETFSRFPNSVLESMGQVPWQPMLHQFWPRVLADSERTMLLCERLTVGRHHWERDHGCHNLEVPISQVCSTVSFAFFALDLLTNLPRFQQIHNESLREFRRIHRIRSRHHPVPALAETDGWRELPLWIWHTERPRRARLFAREEASGWNLAWAEKEMQPLDKLIPRDPDRAVAAWQGLAAQGWKIRSRALTTTLFARLILADLFIHGIGGGIYDELTDMILQRYYGMQPPAFLIVSGTLRLPWPEESCAHPSFSELQRRLRNLDYHPEKFLSSPDTAAATLMEQKEAIRSTTASSKPEKHDRFLALKQLTAALSKRLDEEKQRTHQAMQTRRYAEQGHRWKTNREFPFCLHAEEELKRFFAPFIIA